MQPRFNINRPPVSDEEIEKHKDFDGLVAQFKKQSLKKARGDESWWKNKKIQYTTVILGVTVICTVTYQSIKNDQQNQTKTLHEKITTPKKPIATKNNTTPYVKPAIPKLDKKTTRYTINNQKGAEVKHPSSTRISVPKSTFVDQKGHDIVGDVTLEYREFNDLADIVSGGIPMRHDSLGTAYDLESAGMFEIRASKDGEPVFVKNGNPIKVDLATTGNEPRYHQYYLDTIARNWRFLGPDQLKNTAVASAKAPDKIKLAQLEHEISSVLPKKQDSVEKVYAQRIQRLPSPRQPLKPHKRNESRPNFVLESDQKEFPELAAFKNILFEVGPENHHYSTQLHDVTWSDIRITEGPVKGRNYILHLSHREQKEKLVVYPVLNGEDYVQAKTQYDQLLADYQNKLKERNEREEKLKAELEAEKTKIAREKVQKEEALLAARRASVSRPEVRYKDIKDMSLADKTRRVFEVSKFGIYNSDCPHLANSGNSLQPGFVEHDRMKVLKPETVYLVDHSLNTVVVSDAKNPSLALKEGSQYSLCLIKGGKIYSCDQNTFSHTVDEGKSIFPVKEEAAAAEHIADLRKALGL